jgi:DNA repair protein SbcC/Rad50
VLLIGGVNMKIEKSNNNIEPKDILPTWNEIFYQIEVFRANATEHKKNTKEISKKVINGIDYNELNRYDEYDQTQYYNNVSILGDRGTGKTSLLIELRKQLIENDGMQNIVFDIITPDIRDKEDILGWIISLVIKKANKIKEIKSRNRNISCSTFGKDTDINIDKCIKNLKQAYFFRKSIHEKVIINDYSSKIDYLRDNEDKLNADVDLKMNFSKLIDEIAMFLGNKNEEPLLIFIFDDVDIHANRINEVLTTIMNYLSHPNIVNIIAADYGSALENVTLKMLEEDGILDKDLMNSVINEEDTRSLLKRRDNRGYDFLKKVLPPAYRHYIPTLTNEAKYKILKKYFYEEKVTNEFKCILENIKEYIHYYPKDDKEKVILYDYTSFLDSTIRGCSNVIKFVQSKKIDSEFMNFEKEKKFMFLQELLNVIIESNKSYRDSEEIIRKVINLYQYNKIQSSKDNRGLNFNGYINYYAIIDEINKAKISDDVILSESEFDKYYSIYILSNIFEILIISLNLRDDEKNEKSAVDINKLHGLNELINILNSIKKSKLMKLVPRLRCNLDNKKDIQELICIKENIFRVLRYNEIQQLFEEKNSGYLESIYIDSFNHKGEIVNYIGEMFSQDRDWSTSIVDWIIDNAPSDSVIKNKVIQELEDTYGYSIQEPSENKYKNTLREESIKIKADLWDIANNISDTINAYIDDTEVYKTLLYRINEIDSNITNYEKLIKDIRETLKSGIENQDIELIYINLSNEINNYNNVIENEVNKEMWNKVKEKIIIKGNNNMESLLSWRGETIKLDIKNKLKNFKSNLDESYIKNLQVDEIIIKDESILEDKEMVEFIKKYYESIRIVEILNNHPVIENRNKLYQINQLRTFLNNLIQDKKQIEIRKENIVATIKQNEITKYLINKELKIENIEQVNDDLLLKVLSYEKIEGVTKEFIDVIIAFYGTESDRDKVISFRYLLESFLKKIDDIKKIDKIIVNYLSLEVVKLSQSEINHYKDILNDVNSTLTIIELERLRESSRRIRNELVHQTAEFFYNKNGKYERNNLMNSIKNINEILDKKQSQLSEKSFKLKMDIFNYAFNLTLYNYLNLRVKENNQELSMKVRTNYLKEKRDKLEDMNKKSPSLISFNEYIKSKLK